MITPPPFIKMRLSLPGVFGNAVQDISGLLQGPHLKQVVYNPDIFGSLIGRFVSHVLRLVCHWWKRLLYKPAVILINVVIINYVPVNTKKNHCVCKGCCKKRFFLVVRPLRPYPTPPNA